MYECGCKNGFVLSADGYNCITQVSNKTDSHQHHENCNKSQNASRKESDQKFGGSTPQQASFGISSHNTHQHGETTSSFQNPLHNTIPSKAPLSIHIEVDIDPPPYRTDSKKLSEKELQKLGLPSHHVHWSLPPVLSLSRKDEDLVKEHQKIIEDNTLNDKINEVARLRSKISDTQENDHNTYTENNRQDKKDKNKIKKDGL
jgi:hypothetical protein